MKKLIILAAMSAAAILFPGKSAATPNPLLLNLTVSGTLEVWTNADGWLTNNAGGAQSNKTEVGIAKSITTSFNTKYIYSLISNAVANAYGNLGTNLTATNLPANGYIAFNVLNVDNPGYPDNGESGTFYVTNKSGFYFPLSGYDSTTTNYYSFIELDDNDFDFFDNFFAPSVGAINDKTTAGTFTENEPSVFYVHDNPYSYDDGDYPYEVFYNTMAIEIRSNIRAVWGDTDWDPSVPQGVITKQTDASTSGGCGAAVIKGNNYSAVTSGKITLEP